MNKILVVEDDWDINGLLCNILEQNGYEVKAAYSGSEAKMCLEQGKFDLLLLDLMLPGIKGEDLIDEIRKSSSIPIIVIFQIFMNHHILMMDVVYFQMQQQQLKSQEERYLW